MRIDILTLFPEMFQGPFGESIVKRGLDQALFEIHTLNFRQFSKSKHGKVDDYPFGGGKGMVLQPEPIYDAVMEVKKVNPGPVILTSPKGKPFCQSMAKELAQKEGLIVICGHYEGVDERVKDLLVDYEISIGDYVLTGGELPAMVMVDAIVRLIPGVLSEGSSEEESFEQDLLEYPHYTRPREFMGLAVPDILLSGDHEKIRRWRLKQSLRKTLFQRKDLLDRKQLTKEEQKILKEIMTEGGNSNGFD